jgi:hypothetical protein
MKAGMTGLGAIFAQFAADLARAPKVAEYATRLSQLLGVMDIDLHIEEVTGADKTLDVVVDIFNRVNSGGTKLSKGDLALAKICAEWPDARDSMKAELKEWTDAGYHFSSRLAAEVGEHRSHRRGQIQLSPWQKRTGHSGWAEARHKHIDASLNLIAGRLGLDHDQVFFGASALPVMVCYMDQSKGPLDVKERDKLLFWYP